MKTTKPPTTPDRASRRFLRVVTRPRGAALLAFRFCDERRGEALFDSRFLVVSCRDDHAAGRVAVTGVTYDAGRAVPIPRGSYADEIFRALDGAGTVRVDVATLGQIGRARFAGTFDLRLRFAGADDGAIRFDVLPVDDGASR